MTGRVQILNIHTRKMKSNGKLANDFDVHEFAALTKNFSGAEIEGLVRAAQSCALNRLVKASSKVSLFKMKLLNKNTRFMIITKLNCFVRALRALPRDPEGFL